MTRKDYVALAEGLREAREASPFGSEELVTFDAAIYAITRVLAADNPRFDRDRFLKACGVTL